MPAAPEFKQPMPNNLHKKGKINKQTKQDNSKPNNSNNNNTCTYDKFNWLIGYLMADPGAQADEQQVQKYMMNIVMHSCELNASKACSPYRSKIM